MNNNLKKMVVLGVSAAALSIVATAASADVLPVQNLTFTTFSGPAPKNNFSLVNPANWYRGAPAGQSDLVCIDAPGTATVDVPLNNCYDVYGPFNNPPPGGNFVQADGNPDFFSTFNQDISGLSPGTTYTLSFWQAAGQQNGFSGDTTEQWRVFLGNGSLVLDCSTNPCTVNTAGFTGSEQDSQLMSTPSQGVTDWELVNLSFVADAATETLTFLAWGDGGSTTNLPPTVFLAGVNTPAVPEPATLSVFGAGIVGAVIRRRMKRKASA